MNLGDMKSQCVRFILNTRERVTQPNVPQKYLEGSAGRQGNDSSVYWYMAKSDFMKWANLQFKVDLKAREERLKACPDDILQIFGIATSSYARDDIQKLTESKASKRSELDGPLPYVDAIFSRWQEKFNDPTFQVCIPTRSSKIESPIPLNPNNLERINIIRSYDWVKGCYLKTMKEYNYAMKNWKKETGEDLVPRKILEGIGESESALSSSQTTGSMADVIILPTY